jgi:hypothetical protein
MPIDKPKLDRTVLENHGVTYIEDVFLKRQTEGLPGSAGSLLLPDHVESFREALLHFGSPIPESRRKFFERECQEYSAISLDKNTSDSSYLPPTSAYFKEQETHTRAASSAITAAENNIDENEKLAQKARHFTKKNVSEADWAYFLHFYVFKAFEDTLPSATEYE